jgi:NAD(P)-dependent dehydrogenase (short-subunit alcohol dehydrogenase family)
VRLKGRIALVAGAGRNIGKAISLTYAREGAHLILVSRSAEDELNQVARQCESFGVTAISMLADVADPEQVARVVQCPGKRRRAPAPQAVLGNQHRGMAQGVFGQSAFDVLLCQGACASVHGEMARGQYRRAWRPCLP